MLDLLPLAIGGLALVFAMLPVPGLEKARLVFVLLALGAGNIYLAGVALTAFLIVESHWRFYPGLSARALMWGFVLLLGIGITTAVDPHSSRMYTELAQLVFYIVVALLTLNYVRTGEDVYRVLNASVIAACAAAALGLLAVWLNLQMAPFVYLGRGPNEGAVYIALIGVVPAAVLFVRNKNPAYSIALAFLAYSQYLATSRGELIATGLVTLVMTFFLTRIVLLRAVMIGAGLYLVLISVPTLDIAYQSSLNFSARERLTLFNYAIWLWEQRPLTGWGWGSTTELAERADTVLTYPHFHDTYVQLLVEAGAVGWAIIATFVAFFMRASYLAIVRVRQSAVSTLILASGLALAASGFFDALLYGADRALQVVLLLSLMARTIALARKQPEGWLVEQWREEPGRASLEESARAQ